MVRSSVNSLKSFTSTTLAGACLSFQQPDSGCGVGRVSFEKLRSVDLIFYRLKSLLIISFLCSANLCVAAQTSDCTFYVESDQTRKMIRNSLYPLNFVITENIDATLKINDKGAPNTIGFIFDFEDKSGLPTELGSTLYIKFIDGTTHSIIMRTKKVKTSIIYFTLIEPSSKDNRSLINRLSKVDIVSLAIIADYKQREIFIPKTKAVIIRKTILCLTEN